MEDEHNDGAKQQESRQERRWKRQIQSNFERIAGRSPTPAELKGLLRAKRCLYEKHGLVENTTQATTS